MAVTETGAIFNSLIFGGISSVDYGIYITGEAVYNAPVRAVEMVSVPGRNGAIAIDQGYWENVEVTYPAGCFGTTQTEFAEAIANFRNAIASQLGYQRLTDTYHPEEYRMATYIAGLEVEATNMGVAGEFELKFNCKPQRFLTAGEYEVNISTSGATIGNPTLYEASPLIKVGGYGTITVNGHVIELDNAVMGHVTLAENGNGTENFSVEIPREYFNTGDTIYVQGVTGVWVGANLPDSNGVIQMYNGEVSISDGTGVSSRWLINPYYETVEGGITTKHCRKGWKIESTVENVAFTAGTTTYVHTGAGFAGPVGVNSQTATDSATCSILQVVGYDGDHTISIRREINAFTDNDTFDIATTWLSSNNGTISVDSSVPLYDTPTYIDCDLGVCYTVDNDTVIDLNAYIDLGSDLPALSPGANEITYDNTVTSLDITPRWWQL